MECTVLLTTRNTRVSGPFLADTMGSINGVVLEQHKENIKPYAAGRAASKLSLVLQNPPSKALLAKQRARLEADLDSDDLDDPLQAYLDYIQWTHTNYAAGASPESGLLVLLERCTLCFRDTTYYKNDPRYLRVWLEYAEYSDLPRDIFVYLARKHIGRELALFYELFALFLEARGLRGDAREVFLVGLERHARPETRLERLFKNFELREPCGLLSAEIKAVLTSNPALSVGTHASSELKRRKISVHKDSAAVGVRDLVFADSAKLSSLSPQPVLKAKENRVLATTWPGEVIPQPEPERKPKFLVFKDSEPAQADQQQAYRVLKEGGRCYTLVQNPGKAPEKLAVNMDLLLVPNGDEACPGELLAMAYHMEKRRSLAAKPVSSGMLGGHEHHVQDTYIQNQKRQSNTLLQDGFKTPEPAARFRRALNAPADHQYHKDSHAAGRGSHGNGLDSRFAVQLQHHRISDQKAQMDNTFTLPLVADSSQLPRSPTMTLLSRATTNEVLGMFNTAAHEYDLENDLPVNNEEATNYEDFCTEDLRQATPPTESLDGGSSPFIDQP